MARSDEVRSLIFRQITAAARANAGEKAVGDEVTSIFLYMRARASTFAQRSRACTGRNPQPAKPLITSSPRREKRVLMLGKAVMSLKKRHVTLSPPGVVAP